MNEYHKIQTLFKRDMTTKKKSLIEGQWTLPEFEYLANNRWIFTEKVDWVKRGIQSTWGNFVAEWIVARPKVELLTRNRQRIITKIKGCDFQ